MTQEAAFGPLQGVKVLELGHVMAGPICGMMLKFSRTPAEVRRGAPVLGQHSREILAEIGLAPRK